MLIQTPRWIASMLLTFTLLACGGGGGGDDSNTNNDTDGGGSANTSLDYSGETKQAELTTENVDDLANAAASGSKQAISSDDVPLVGLRSDSPVSRDQIGQAISRLIGDALHDRPEFAARGTTAARTEDLSSTMCDSGSVIMQTPDNGAAGDWSIDFNQCSRTTRYGSDSYSSVIDGAVEGTYVQVGNGYRLTLDYSNFTVTVSHPGGSYSDTFNMQMTCSASTRSGADVSCTYYADYRGYDNRTYRVSEVQVSGDESSGYRVSVRVYDPDHGYVLVTTEVPVTYDCSAGRPSAGRIRIEGANGEVALIEFISCAEYVVTYNGTAETYSWP